MNFFLSSISKEPLYEQIMNQIKKLIYNKELISGEQLPSVRKLALELGVGVITAKRAYDELIKLKLVVSKEAVGYFVANIDLDELISNKKTNILNEIKQQLKNAKENLVSIEDIDLIVKEVYEDEKCNWD